jgi:small-conductance mechanosensitive channel
MEELMKLKWQKLILIYNGNELPVSVYGKPPISLIGTITDIDFNTCVFKEEDGPEITLINSKIDLEMTTSI